MGRYPDSVIADINGSIDARRLLELIAYKVDKIQETADTIKAFCPIHNETMFRNLIVDKKRNTFRCKYSACEGTEGGNLILLFALARKIPFEDAVSAVMQALGIEVNISLDPEFVQRTLQIAQNYLDLGALEEAEQEFQHVLAMQPESRKANEGLLETLVAMGNFEAEFDARKAVVEILRQEGDNEQALERAKPLVELKPDDISAHRILADCYLKVFDSDAALGELLTVADLCELTNDLEGAVEAYKRADDLHLDVVDVVPHIVRVYENNDKLDDAVEFLTLKAERAAQAGDYARATELYAIALPLSPTRNDIRARYIEIATLAEPTSEITESIWSNIDELLAAEAPAGPQLLEGLLDNPTYGTGALTRLTEHYKARGEDSRALDMQVHAARLSYDSGNTDDALDKLRRVLSAQPNHIAALKAVADIEGSRKNQPAVHEVYWKLADIYAGEGRYAEAVETFDQILLGAPEAVEARERRAEILADWASTADPSMTQPAVDAFMELAGVHEGFQQSESAIRAYEKAMQLAGETSAPMLAVARLKLALGDTESARELVLGACEYLEIEDHGSEAIAEATAFESSLGQDVVFVRYLADLYARENQPETATVEYLHLADLCLAAKDLPKAEEALDRAIGLQPENIGALEKLASVYLQRKDSSNHTRILFRLVGIYEEQGRLDLAINALETLVGQNPAEVSAITRLIEANDMIGEEDEAQKWRLKLVAIHHERGDWEREARVLREALSHAPDDETILESLVECEFARYEPEAASSTARRLALVKKANGKDAESRAVLSAALKKAPDNLELSRDLFDALCEAGQRQEAVTHGLQLIDLLMRESRHPEAAAVYDRVVSCDADNLTLKLNQVEFLRRISRQDEAVEKLFALSKLYQAREHFEEAENLLLQALTDDLASIPAREELVELYQRLGNNDKLEEQLGQLAEAYMGNGETDKAIACLEKIIQWNPDSITTRRQLSEIFLGNDQVLDAIRELHAASSTLRRNGSEMEALEAERQAAALAPENTQVRRRLVDGLTRAGEVEQAAGELERLTGLHVDKQRYTEAMQTVTDWLQLTPDSFNARRMRAELYAKMGDNEKALEAFRDLASSVPSTSTQGTPQPAEPLQMPLELTLQIVKEYDFDHFVVGSHNNFAYATALAVARAPARAYNPLFIYSDVGLGKTHLANAIANFILRNDPKARIIYTNSEDFTGEVVAAIQANSINQFRMRYKAVDVLIVDDVQFLAGKERAQEEFFHVFNALFQAKRQIVVTSDRPPKDIARLENRLLSRFGAGVIVDVQSPDLETRIAILNREIENADLKIEPGIAMKIAERIDSNVRELKGALNQAVAMRDLRNEPLTEENIITMLDAVYSRS